MINFCHSDTILRSDDSDKYGCGRIMRKAAIKIMLLANIFLPLPASTSTPMFVHIQSIRKQNLDLSDVHLCAEFCQYKTRPQNHTILLFKRTKCIELVRQWFLNPKYHEIQFFERSTRSTSFGRKIVRK